MNRMHRSLLLTSLLTSVVLLSHAPIAAAAPQTAAPVPDARWASWIGCWASNDGAADASMRQCVMPTDDGRGVRMLTFSGDRQLLEETIVADGTPQPFVDKQCQGERRAQWSADGERLLTRSELRCADRPTLRTAGIATLAHPSEWLDVQTVLDDGETRVRVRRYVRDRNGWPESLLARREQLPPAPPARIGAITAEDVLEAHEQTDSVAVQTWLMETQAQVAIDKRTLVLLADHGVDESVLDLLVARAYPRRFEVRRQRSSDVDFGSFSDPQVQAGINSAVNPYALYFAPFGSYYSGLYSGLYGGFGGFGGLASNYWQWSGYVQVPTVVSGNVDQTPGQAVKGRGYTRIVERAPQSAVSRGGGGSGDGGAASSDGGGGGGGGGGSASPSGYSGGGGGSAGGGGAAIAVPK